MPSPKKYTALPIDVYAVQVTDSNIERVTQWCGGDYEVMRNPTDPLAARRVITIYSFSGVTVADVGDFILEALNGEYYAIKPDVFKQMFAEV